MDGTSETHAPFRDARYAPPALDVERRGDVLILRNPTPYSKTVQTVTAPPAENPMRPTRLGLTPKRAAFART